MEQYLSFLQDTPPATLLLITGLLCAILGITGGFKIQGVDLRIKKNPYRVAALALALVFVGGSMFWSTDGSLFRVDDGEITPILAPTKTPLPPSATPVPPTETPTPTIEPTRTPEPTEVIISTCVEGEQGDKPCYHVVRPGDNYPSIAAFRYGNQCMATILRSANRSWDGLYQGLRDDEELLVPDTLLIPTPEYPPCGPYTAFPCAYEVDGPFMYFEWLAEMYYGNPELDGWIRSANLGLCDEPIAYLLNGFVAVVPVQPAE